MIRAASTGSEAPTLRFAGRRNGARKSSHSEIYFTADLPTAALERGGRRLEHLLHNNAAASQLLAGICVAAAAAAVPRRCISRTSNAASTTCSRRFWGAAAAAGEPTSWRRSGSSVRGNSTGRGLRPAAVPAALPVLLRRRQRWRPAGPWGRQRERARACRLRRAGQPRRVRGRRGSLPGLVRRRG